MLEIFQMPTLEHRGRLQAVTFFYATIITSVGEVRAKGAFTVFRKCRDLKNPNLPPRALLLLKCGGCKCHAWFRRGNLRGDSTTSTANPDLELFVCSTDSWDSICSPDHLAETQVYNNPTRGNESRLCCPKGFRTTGFLRTVSPQNVHFCKVVPV